MKQQFSNFNKNIVHLLMMIELPFIIASTFSVKE